MATIRNTLQLLSSNVQRSVAEKRADLTEVEQQAMTGLKARHPSDLPSGWYEAHALRAQIADQQTYAENGSRADTYLTTADGALDAGTELLMTAHERAVQAASETLGPEQRVTMAVEIEALRDQLIGVANTRLDDRYLFAGEAYDSEAYNTAGIYLGDTDEPTTLVGADRTLKTGFDGSEIFQDTVDTFQVLDDLATAMRADDAEGVADLLDDLDLSLDQIIEKRQRIGYLMQDSEDAQRVAESAKAVFTSRLNDTIGTDPIDVYTELANMRTAYEGALQVSASAISGAKLFDFLR